MLRGGLKYLAYGYGANLGHHVLLADHIYRFIPGNHALLTDHTDHTDHTGLSLEGLHNQMVDP